MPVEVATEMLAAPKARLTGTMRRACIHARERVYISEQEPKDGVLKLTERLERKSYSQLLKWLKRSNRRRAKTQAAYMKLQEQEGIKAEVKEVLSSILDAKAHQLDSLIDGLEEEIKARHKR